MFDNLVTIVYANVKYLQGRILRLNSWEEVNAKSSDVPSPLPYFPSFAFTFYLTFHPAMVSGSTVNLCIRLSVDA